jgi:hypothetical protein
MDRFVDNLFVRLRERGFQARIVSVSHLHQLQKEIESLRSQALLDSLFYQDRLAWFSFQIPQNLPKAQSLIVVAVPRPQTRDFHLEWTASSTNSSSHLHSIRQHNKTSWKPSHKNTRRKRLQVNRNCAAPQTVGSSKWSRSIRQEQYLLCF